MDAQLSAIAGVDRRRLGEQERILHMIHGIGTLLAGQVLHIRGPLDAALARRALDHMQQCHPMLQAHVVFRGIGVSVRYPFFTVLRDFVMEGTGKIPLVEVPPGDWQAYLRRELTRPIARSRRRPRIRATLMHPGADGITRMIFLADHSIGDAPAAALGARSFMEFLADETRAVPVTTGLPPALEERYPAKADSRRPDEPAIRLPYTPQRGVRNETWTYESNFTPDEGTAIKAAAAAHRTTVHGVVGAAVLTAVHEHYGMDRMSLVSTFELRRLCRPPIPADTYGCYIDALRTTHDISGPFWPLAKDVAFKLIATLAKDQQSASILKVPSPSVLVREGRGSAATHGRVDGVGVTTGGDTGLLRDYGRFTLEDVTIGISMHIYGPGMFVATQERLGQMRMTVCYTPKAVPTVELRQIVDRTAAILRALPA